MSRDQDFDDVSIGADTDSESVKSENTQNFEKDKVQDVGMINGGQRGEDNGVQEDKQQPIDRWLIEHIKRTTNPGTNPQSTP